MLLLLMLAGRPAAIAMDEGVRLPGADTPYRFIGTNQELAAALRLFGKNLGIAVDIDPAISGTIGQRPPPHLTGQAYLEQLAAEFGLVWFFDGTMLHVSPAGSVETELFAMERNDGRRVLRSMARLGIYQAKFMHRFDPRNRVLLVSGPPAYVRIVKKTVEAVEKAERTEVTILRGIKAVPVPPVILEEQPPAK